MHYHVNGSTKMYIQLSLPDHFLKIYELQDKLSELLPISMRTPEAENCLKVVSYSAFCHPFDKTDLQTFLWLLVIQVPINHCEIGNTDRHELSHLAVTQMNSFSPPPPPPTKKKFAPPPPHFFFI